MNKFEDLIYITFFRNNTNSNTPRLFIYQIDEDSFCLYKKDIDRRQTEVVYSLADIYTHFYNLFGVISPHRILSFEGIFVKEFESCTTDEIEKIVREIQADKIIKELINGNFLLSNKITLQYDFRNDKTFFEISLNHDKIKHGIYKNYAFLQTNEKAMINPKSIIFNYTINERPENYSHVLSKSDELFDNPNTDITIMDFYYPHIIEDLPFRYKSQFNTIEFKNLNLSIDLNNEDTKTIIETLEKYTISSYDHRLLANVVLCNLARNYNKIKNVFEKHADATNTFETIINKFKTDWITYIKNNVFSHDDLVNNIILFFERYCSKNDNSKIKIEIIKRHGDLNRTADLMDKCYNKKYKISEYEII